MNRREFLHGGAGALLGGTLLSGAFPCLGFANPNALSWISPARINLSHSYVLAGAKKGWFRDVGLEVEIRGGSGTAQSVTQVSSANSTFGQAASMTSCPAIADQKAGIITIGQVCYRGFFELASLKKKPVRHPSDWLGKSVGIMSLGGTTDILLRAMAMNVGQDPDKVNKVVTGTSASGAAFLQRGDVDAFFVFPDSKITLQKMGIELEYLATDAFAPMPGDAILASRKAFESAEYRSSIVKFLRVCRKGLDYMRDERNFDELVRIAAEFNPIEGQDIEKGRAVLAMLREYYAPVTDVQPLVCDAKAWEDAIRLMEKIELIKTTGLSVGTFVDTKLAEEAVA